VKGKSFRLADEVRHIQGKTAFRLAALRKTSLVNEAILLDATSEALL
jgi:hypothetical protein